MKLRSYLYLLFTALILTGCNGGNNKSASQISDEQLAQIKQVLVEAKNEYGLSAVIFGVWEGERERMTIAFGSSTENSPAHKGMNYRAGGVTEIMLTTILLQLIDENRYGVTLDDKIAKWFPDFPYSQQVTLRMLGNSTSGYFDYLNSPQISNDKALYTKNWDPLELVTVGVTHDILFEPGTQFRYSHTDFCILGLILEKITHKSLPQLVEEYIARPLHLTNTSYTTSSTIPAPALHSFVTENSIFRDATSWSATWAGPSGLVVSNLAELGKWMHAFGTGKLLSEESYRQQTQEFPPGRLELGFAQGFIVSNSWYYQNPHINGYKTIAAYFKPKNLSLIITVTDGKISNPEAHYAKLIFPKIAQILAPDYPVVEIPR